MHLFPILRGVGGWVRMVVIFSAETLLVQADEVIVKLLSTSWQANDFFAK